jgi:hypothetical protein
VTNVWQKAVFEKAHRLVRLHEAIEQVEGRVSLPANTLVTIHLGVRQDEDPLRGLVEVSVERGHLLGLLKDEEQEIITDLARILRQVAEP